MNWFAKDNHFTERIPLSDFALISAASIFLIGPLLTPHWIRMGESIDQVVRVLELARGIREGSLYPRWFGEYLPKTVEGLPAREHAGRITVTEGKASVRSCLPAVMRCFAWLAGKAHVENTGSDGLEGALLRPSVSSILLKPDSTIERGLAAGAPG